MVRKQYIQFPAFFVNQAEQNKPSQWEEMRKKNIALLVYMDGLKELLFYFLIFFTKSHCDEYVCEYSLYSILLVIG